MYRILFTALFLGNFCVNTIGQVLPKKPARPTINKNSNLSKNNNILKSESIIAAFDLNNDNIIKKNELTVAINFLVEALEILFGLDGNVLFF